MTNAFSRFGHECDSSNQEQASNDAGDIVTRRHRIVACRRRVKPFCNSVHIWASSAYSKSPIEEQADVLFSSFPGYYFCEGDCFLGGRNGAMSGMKKSWDGKDHDGKGYYYLRTGDKLNTATRVATLVPHPADTTGQ
jgi:hypothetical protein